MSSSNERSLREQYQRANQYRKLAFVERPFFGSPAAPAQAETNVSNIWGHINAGYLFGYEYTRWYEECRALRSTAMLGDWSWLNKVIVRGPDAAKFMNYATVKDLSRQEIGQIMFAPMVSEQGKVAIEGLASRLAEDEYLFTQSGAQSWLERMQEKARMDVHLEDVTPELTCFALQGPRSIDVLEALTGEEFRDLRFSRWRKTELFGAEVIVARQGVTGEVGYEFFMRTENGRAHELWRELRRVGRDFGLRELGLKAQMVGHTETGIATVVRDYLPDRMPAERLPRFARLWTSEEELAAIDWDLGEQLCSPAELGWGFAIDLDGGDFHGRSALLREADAGGPGRTFVGLIWSSDDMADLYAAQFRDEPAPPPPDLPYGQFRMQFLKILKQGMHVGWASGAAYSPNLRRMISLARVSKDLAASGTQVTVAWGGFTTEPTWEIRAEVVELPFIEHNRLADLTAAATT